MKKCLLLMLSTDHLHAQRMLGDKIVDEREFSDTVDGKDDFADFLRTIHCPTYLLTDLIEEDFRLETIPYLRGSSQRALLQRKFDQFYRGTPFQQATLLQRQTTGRRDADMLFSALTNPSLITPWVDVMLAHHIPLVGIYSVPQISTPLVVDSPSSHLLLITWNQFAGLRETYFSSHRLQISRLTPCSKGLTFQDAVVSELSRTYQYLKSLSLLPAGQILDVRIVGNSNDLIELQTRLPRSEDMRYDFVDMAALTKKLKITNVRSDSDANQIFLRQLAVKQPKSQYGNATHTHFYSLWKLRLGLYFASTALVIGSIFWAVQATYLQDTPDQKAIDSIKQRTSQIHRDTQAILQSLPKTSVAPQDVKSSITALHGLHERSNTPQEFLMPFSLVMDRFPRIQLDSLAWQSSNTEAIPQNGQVGITAQVITIKGHLDDAASSYRAALNYLDQFQKALEQQRYQVSTIDRPLDVTPKGSLSDMHDTTQPVSGFTLKLVWRPVL